MDEQTSKQESASLRRQVAETLAYEIGELIETKLYVQKGSVVPRYDVANVIEKRLELEGWAEAVIARQREAVELSKAVRLQRLVSLHARWLEAARTMDALADECADLCEDAAAGECVERSRTFLECARELSELWAGMEANAEVSDPTEEGSLH